MMLFFYLFTAVAFALPTKIIKVGNHALKVELALTAEDQQRGLMKRKKLTDKEGMLFVFDEEKPVHFWMKDTFIPLSIGFFDEDKKLFQIEDMEPASPMDLEPPTTKSKKPAKYALEVSRGWFKKNKIKIGEKLNY